MSPRQIAPILGFLLAAATRGATFTVLTANDSGGGSLRQAITDANANAGPDVISFNISGLGVHTITLASPLPAVVESVLIDGYTQPGASPNTLPDGNDAVILIEVASNFAANGLELQGSNATVRGLVIHGVIGITDAAILLGGTGGHVVAGNFLCTDATGTVAVATSVGVEMESPNNVVGGTNPEDRNLISGCAAGILFDLGSMGSVARGNFIGTDRTGTAALPNQYGIDMGGGLVGGSAAGARNVISGNSQYGVWVTGSESPAVIQGNFIGTDVTGTQAIPNTFGGVVIWGVDGSVIGGAAPGAGNLISGNPARGVLLEGSFNTVQGNFIGTDVTGTSPLGNGHGIQVGGVTIVAAADNLIGGTGPGEANVIAHNTDRGIWIPRPDALRNTIRRNRVFRNGELGIELDSDGITANDTDDSDTGPNGLLNFPLLRSVTAGAGTTHIEGTYTGAPDSFVTLDFFWNPCNFRPRDPLQGENFIASALVVTDANGFAVIDALFSVTIPAGATVSATATDGDGNTSEFSQQIVFSIFPTSGPAAGGTPVFILGTNFDPAVTVTIGGAAPGNLVRMNDQVITAEAPALPAGSLNDVVVTNPDTTAGTLLKGWVADFLDVPAAHQFHDFVTRLVSNGVTVGCGGGLYCVDNSTTRGQMAAFLIKARLGFCFTPPPATGTVFTDVPASNIYAPWIEELQRQGLTAGCGGGNYCPGASVTRAQMAVFLLNTAYGPGYVPPPATGTVFDDVPLGAFADEWIEDLVGRGITAGCSASPPLYCPGNPVTRGQMATFIVKTFNLQP